jgi:hypothetical protein
MVYRPAAALERYKCEIGNTTVDVLVAKPFRADTLHSGADIAGQIKPAASDRTATGAEVRCIRRGKK